MKMYQTVAITALLCSLLWIGGTAVLIDEYIKVVQTKEFQLQIKHSELKESQQLNMVYDTILKDFMWRCVNKEEIRISNRKFMCHKIDKV